MSLPSYKDYKNNLIIIGENKLVSIIDNDRLGIDDRYFNYYRTSYSIDDIINIVDKSSVNLPELLYDRYIAGHSVSTVLANHHLVNKKAFITEIKSLLRAML